MLTLITNTWIIVHCIAGLLFGWGIARKNYYALNISQDRTIVKYNALLLPFHSTIALMQRAELTIVYSRTSKLRVIL